MTEHNDVTELTEVEPFSESRLRAAVAHVLRLDVAQDGSLHLRVLACAYLSAPHGSEPALSNAYHAQAKLEGTDPDELLLQLVGLVLDMPEDGGAN